MMRITSWTTSSSFIIVIFSKIDLYNVSLHDYSFIKEIIIILKGFVILPVPLMTQVQMQVLDLPEICLVRLVDLLDNKEEVSLYQFPF